MAKRRNPKKEKAQRNQAYARKFRKRKSPARFSRQQSPKPDEMEEEESDFSGSKSSSMGRQDR